MQEIEDARYDMTMEGRIDGPTHWLPPAEHTILSSDGLHYHLKNNKYWCHAHFTMCVDAIQDLNCWVNGQFAVCGHSSNELCIVILRKPCWFHLINSFIFATLKWHTSSSAITFWLSVGPILTNTGPTFSQHFLVERVPRIDYSYSDFVTLCSL